MMALAFLALGRQKKYGRHAETAFEYDGNGAQNVDYIAFGNTVVMQYRNEQTAAVGTILACRVPAPLNDRDAIRMEKY